MKIEGYEEISEEEYDELPDDGTGAIFADDEQGKYYFKKAQKFPIVFEDDEKKIGIDKDGLWILDVGSNDCVYLWFNKSFPLLKQAMNEIDELGLAKAKEVMNKK